jgi:hypothetical protein
MANSILAAENVKVPWRRFRVNSVAEIRIRRGNGAAARASGDCVLY